MKFSQDDIKQLAGTDACQTMAAIASLQRLLISKGLITYEENISCYREALKVVLVAVIDAAESADPIPSAEQKANTKIQAWIETGNTK